MDLSEYMHSKLCWQIQKFRLVDKTVFNSFTLRHKIFKDDMFNQAANFN